MRALSAIVQILEEASVGIGGTTIFAGSDTDIPGGGGPFLTLIETAGKPPITAHNATPIRQPSFQVTSRGDEYQPTAALLDLAYIALGGAGNLVNFTVDDIFFLMLRPTSEPLGLPNDVRGRVRLAFNIQCKLSVIGQAEVSVPAPWVDDGWIQA